MSFATSGDVWSGPITIVGRDTAGAGADRFTITGMLPEKPTLTFEQKKTTIQFNDGSESESPAGWTGHFKIPLDAFDQTTITGLETYKPGAADDVDEIKITFTALGTGTDHYVTLKQVSAMSLGISTADHWVLDIDFTITGASTDDLSDLIVFTQP